MKDHYREFANVIKQHRFLRMGALCEIGMYSGDRNSVFIESALSKSGRRIHEFWTQVHYLGNFRKKYSYRAQKSMDDFNNSIFIIEHKNGHVEITMGKPELFKDE